MADFTPVQSTNLAAVAYDRATTTLLIRFRGGSVYSYAGVPESVYSDLMSAESKGRYFAKFIRTRFPFKLVAAAPLPPPPPPPLPLPPPAD